MLIKNAKIITMADKNYERADIYIKDGNIEQIGENLDYDCEVFNAEGYVAYPGFVDAHSHIGMWEDGLPEGEGDGNEMTDPVTPELRAIDAINPMDNAFFEARMAGVTTVVTGPGSANVLSGQFAAIKTAGICIDEMIVKEPCALKAALGENPKRVYGAEKKSPSTRMATASILRKEFVGAEHYVNELFSEESTQRDLKKEILAQALDGELPVKFHCHRADDIFTAIRIAKEFGIQFSLDHCTEGHLIADYITGQKVIVGPLLTDRCKTELKNLSMEAPKILHEKGVEFAMMTDHPVIPEKYLPLCAMLAVREGLPEEAALRSITINAAKACFIDEFVGSLEVKKEADILLFKGNPLETPPVHVFIRGEKVK